MIFFLSVFMFVFALIALSYSILGKKFFLGTSNLHNLKILWDADDPLIPIKKLANKEWNNKLLRLFYFHSKLLFFFKITIIMQLVILSVSAIFLPPTFNQSDIRIVDLFATDIHTQSPPDFIVLYLLLVLIYILILIFSWLYIDFVESETKKIKEEIENFVLE